MTCQTIELPGVGATIVCGRGAVRLADRRADVWRDVHPPRMPCTHAEHGRRRLLCPGKPRGEAVARREGLVKDAERCAARAARWRRRALDHGEELPKALAGDIQAADDPQEWEQTALFGEAR